jgi:hypothetical protein
MSTTRFHDGAADVDALYASLAAADPQSLWTQSGLLTPTPGRLAPHVWRWKAPAGPRPSSAWRQRGEYSRDARRPSREHLVLGLLREERSKPVVGVDERDHPPGRPVDFCDGSGHVHHRPQRGLVPAVPLGHGDLEEAGLGNCVDAVVGYTAVGVAFGGVFPQQWPQRLRLGDEPGSSALARAVAIPGAGPRLPWAAATTVRRMSSPACRTESLRLP